jgi:hypothetical protein
MNKYKPNNSEGAFVAISAVLAILSIVFFILIVFFPGTLSKIGLTGFATAGNTTSGKINLTIEQGLIINFTTDLIEWGLGSVNIGSQNATLDSSRNTSETKVVNGNWYMTNSSLNFNRTRGLVLENIGNLNTTLYIKTGKTAATFIGGSGPEYKINITNNKSSSCGQNESTTGNSSNALNFTLGLYYNVNTTGDGARICDWFNFDDTKDQLRIHVFLRVPSDSLTGNLEDIITATAYQS